jgi:predicted RNase H-like HicB family nuclease
MIRQYVGEALHRASYSVLESNVYCATVAGLPGVIATGATLETCRDQLAEIVEEWLLLRVSRGLSIPRLGTARVEVRRVS